MRKSLLSEGKIGKYLKYAIGEIVLVVIGILIALQVNNWNELRKDRANEKLTVQTIYDELTQNLGYSTSVLSQIEARLSGAMTLMEFTANPDKVISPVTFDSLTVQAFISPAYTPIKADLDRVLASEQIDLIRSIELQEGLSDYKSSMDQTALYYSYAQDDFQLIVLPYFLKHYPLKAFLTQYGFEVASTKHKKNHEDLLASLEFENVLTLICADAGGRLLSINENINLIKETKSLIEKEYPINTGHQ
ncbi:MAG: DUF6090 family protein [Aurantibacter sp.]